MLAPTTGTNLAMASAAGLLGNRPVAFGNRHNKGNADQPTPRYGTERTETCLNKGEGGLGRPHLIKRLLMKRPVPLRLLGRVWRAHGRSSCKRHRIEPEEFRQALSPEPSALPHRFHGYRLRRSLFDPTN